MNESGSSFTFHLLAPSIRGPMRAEWLLLRHALWHDHLASLDTQLDDLTRLGVTYVAFLVCLPDGKAVAFAEAALRPYVNGCETSQVAFLEGIYVEPEYRKRGLARQLVTEVEDWAHKQGCSEFASDIHEDNQDSHAMHLALGFQETKRVIYFRKKLA